MQKLISILVAAMCAAVTFGAIAADNKGSTDAAKARTAAPKAKPNAATASQQGKPQANPGPNAKSVPKKRNKFGGDEWE